ncbi:MAG TPA: hypothetical protein DEF27_10455 [Oscillatoriales bacterium UBA8482]|nr:MAG: hypothetical protein AUK43_00285 [Oscillatoriales cyanobacterium CG2_30_40_61]HBW58191.1 hypothetical protein [Oscillatoriales bacterium UBA8482]
MTSLTIRQFTVNEYHRLIELNFFQTDERVELIRGEIVKMAAKGTAHAVCNTRLMTKLVILINERAIIRGQEPIILPSNSEPQPDVAIVKNRDDDYLSSHPQPEDILLVIEISDSSLNYDQDVKLSLYAEAQIHNYWIFNLIDDHLETYTEPYQERNGIFRYRTKRIFLKNELVLVPGFHNIYINLSEIFLGIL